MTPTCDSHVHLLALSDPSAFGSLEGYLEVRRVFGTKRVVVVQSKTDGLDTTRVEMALDRLSGDARGVVVVDPAVSDAELRRLHAAGVRGIRFSLWDPMSAVLRREGLPLMARRIAPMGWHLQIHMSSAQIADAGGIIVDQGANVVIDHMGRLPPGLEPTAHPAFDLVRGLAQDGRAWVKLSGPYLNRRPGAAGDDDPRRIASAWIEAIPDRLIWGSDWPHITERRRSPAAAEIARTLETWCNGDAALLNKIARSTPAELYDFAPDPEPKKTKEEDPC